MFIGDRGFGVGSRIKGFRRYGGAWKQNIHGQYTNACITNERNTSQTCVFCFNKLDHPKCRKMMNGKEVLVNCKGSFVCRNPECPLLKRKRATQSRDKTSALAIALSGLSMLLFRQTFHPFSNASHCNTDFNNETTAFLTERARMGCSDATIRGKQTIMKKDGNLLYLSVKIPKG
jgi:hypothetical protein